jgi:hypothetical protein
LKNIHGRVECRDYERKKWSLLFDCFSSLSCFSCFVQKHVSFAHGDLMLDIAKQLESHRGAMKLPKFAEVMGVCYMTAFRWVRDDGLPTTKIGGTHWVDPHQAAAWWRAHSMIVVKPPRTVRQRGRAAGERKVSDAA